MINITTLLTKAGKKVAKAAIKKDVRNKDDKIDELFTWISPFPWDAKELNVGEDERVRQREIEWKKMQREIYEKNQCKDMTKELPLSYKRRGRSCGNCREICFNSGSID